MIKSSEKVKKTHDFLPEDCEGSLEFRGDIVAGFSMNCFKQEVYSLGEFVKM